jgi:hypothetical protein
LTKVSIIYADNTCKNEFLEVALPFIVAYGVAELAIRSKTAHNMNTKMAHLP